jgi:6,7-dimethyl-8-ribityllumazine synthase
MATQYHNLSVHDSAKVPSGKDKRIAIAVSEWNESITSALLQGTYDTLVQYGVAPDDIDIRYVPGSFELPLAARRATLSTKRYNAIICLGCVIQGETRHFDFICAAAAQGIMDVMLKFNIPVVFGVLTTNTLEQAQERAGGKHGNKGVEAALTALKMMSI